MSGEGKTYILDFAGIWRGFGSEEEIYKLLNSKPWLSRRRLIFERHRKFEGKRVELAEGQRWTYDSRDGEERSTVTIVKIEKGIDDEDIIHVWVDNLSIHNPTDPAQPIDVISHMPFSQEAVFKSIKTFCGMVEIPDYRDGYEVWKECYEKGEAGVYSVSIGESVRYMEETLNDGED